MRFNNTKISQSLSILGLNGQDFSMKDVKDAYKKSMLKYHPDINPGGHKMAQVINAAWDFLKALEAPFSTNEGQQENYTGQLSDALAAILDLSGLEIEICGTWVWVSGDTKTHKDILKEQGFRYHGAKKMWYMAPSGYIRKGKRKSYSHDEIKEKYGSQRVQKNYRKAIGQ